jgi:hypothetical protein
MNSRVRNIAGALAMGTAVLATPSSAALAMPIAPADELYQVGQVGLVNVSLGNVTILRNVNVAVAANVIANVCGNNIGVGVLAQQIQTVGESSCDPVGNALPGPLTITRA